MDEEYDIEDNLEIFNANFECDDQDQIIDLYKIKETVEDNDIITKKIVKKKYNHPLFLNYNYCLFCLERRKTKYNQQNLSDIHDIVNIKTIGSILEKDQIYLKIPKNKIERLSRRRFIHSSEHIKKNFNEFNKLHDSDTELYIEKENDNEETNNLINFYKKYKSSIDYTKRKNTINVKKSNEKKVKFHSKNSNIDDIFESDDSKSDDTEIVNNKKKRVKLTKTFNHNKTLSKPDVIVNTKTKNNENEEENFFNTRRKSDPNILKQKPLSIFGFITNYFNKSINEEVIKESYVEHFRENDDKSFEYFEKNEKCGICLGEIKDKFTLFCGDFFCRECIINLMIQSIDNITLFDKMECPRCHDPINESTIKFLLNREYIQKYNKIKTRIDGLKDKKNIPCPHPDCEGFALKEEEINGTLECQNGHIFCHKCLEEVNQKFRLEPNNVHVCVQKFPETLKLLKSDKNIRKCPQCKSWVQRDPGGCNYFRCSNIWCKYEFCWICGKKYEPSHYRNPLSTCFRLDKSNYQSNLAKSLRIRRIRCVLIFLLFLLILFPIICIFFSFFGIGSFIMYFQFDGKELRNVRFHSKFAHKVFYIFYFLFFICISIGLVPFGYMCLVLLILLIPIFAIISKIKKRRGNYDF